LPFGYIDEYNSNSSKLLFLMVLDMKE